MSGSRRLRRQQARAIVESFTTISKSPACAAHGCEICRGDERRRVLAADLVATRQLCAVKAQCTDCGAFWRVELFAFGPRQELRIAFQPVARERPN